MTYIILELLKPITALTVGFQVLKPAFLLHKGTDNKLIHALNSIVPLYVEALDMEQDIAILIADLSGYTALTETHGAATAADIIDRYMEVVSTSLVGSSRLHQRVGDEVLLVSDSADTLLATAVQLLQQAHQIPDFLQLHGALHYGTVLFRNNDIYGNTINLTSRLASKAASGCMVCSADFIRALNNKEALPFKSKGRFNFKNVSEEKEVMELVIERPEAFHTDPVCRMLVNTTASTYRHPLKAGLYFCSQHCLDVYLKKEHNE